ncbi:chemotaxis protein CheD [Vannielia litorea]|uniref:Probable chemoreceptor glutamine deamidase CheD n=1 Tax=Vannielia litorea TaxID=1217970 RepID=A0A1N6F2N3_9RHOB|nr:chemotaxis protein CheD [Vannielia litorea]SIN89542.1 chemotaxis protein CheD [Vannielia litorea]
MMQKGSTMHVAQGEFGVSGDPAMLLTTILGSCVSVCLWDNHARLGGMNHILLPGGGGTDLYEAAIGANAMELLINGMLKAGAHRDRLEAKVFGGARMIKASSDIGARNGAFVIEFLERERIPLTAQSLGGTQGRRVQFWPESGRARQMLIAKFDEPRPPVSAPRPAEAGDDLELF